jgi:hypothetical protein
MSLRWLTITLVSSGTLLALFVVAFKQEGQSTYGWFPLVFVLGPWLILDAIFIVFRQARGIAIAAGLMLAFEVAIYISVFLNPHRSTDATVYVLKPFIQLLIFVPVGLLIGALIDKRKKNI